MANPTPNAYGLYLCRIEGWKNCPYAVLKYTKEGWWQFMKDYSDARMYEGWFGLDKAVQIKSYNLLQQED